MFQRVNKEVRKLFLTGTQLYSSNNYTAAIQMFRRSVGMLHKCRLADEKEEKKQEALLLKLYLNLAICYNKNKQPLRACTACNEINNLINIWNNSKVLFQNAKALRMIGEFQKAEKKLTRALKLDPENVDMIEEMNLIKKAREYYNHSKLTDKKQESDVSEHFKSEIINMLQQFKEDKNIQKFTLPTGLNKSEIEFIKKLCKEQNLSCSLVHDDFAIDKMNRKQFCENNNDNNDDLKF